MHPDLHRYLDGDLGRDALPRQLSTEVEEWEALLAEAAELRNELAPPWIEARVMASLPPAPAPWRRGWRWLLEPRPIRLRPATLAFAALLAALLVIRGPGAREQPTAGAPGVATAETPVYVQFIFAGPSASTVAVAGDFNGWTGERHALRDPDGDGVWTGMFALPPGLHKYMFVVDGEHWVTDPRAERYVEDGFGMRNALIAVAPPVRRAS